MPLLVQYISSCYSSSGSAAAPGSSSMKGISSLRSRPSSGGSSQPDACEAGPALRLLQRLVAADADTAMGFAEHGLIAALLQLLQAPACTDSASTRQGVLLLLSELCAVGSAFLRKLREADGVAVLLRECERCAHCPACCCMRAHAPAQPLHTPAR